MAYEASINTFTGGMDMDTDVSLLQPSKYRKAVNFRLTAGTAGTAGALEMVLGTEVIPILSGSISGSVFSYCWMRDNLVVFTTDNKIYVITFNSSFTSITDIRLAYSNTNLNFSSARPIKAIARYETEDIQKIYWTDGYYPVRFANIAASNTALLSLSVDKLEFLPITLSAWNSSKPTLTATSVAGGFYTAGKIQYALQFVSQSGTESPIYLYPDFYHIAKGSDGFSSDKNYVGAGTGDSVNKGFVLTANNIPTGVYKLRLIAVKYDSYNQEPSIRIVSEIAASNITNVTITDLGSTNLGEYSLEELSVLSSSLFTAKDIETKNDVLFAANIDNETWDVDYDARAYRFAGVDNTQPLTRGRAGILDSTGAFYELDSFFQFVGLGQDVPETHDCINPYNNRQYEIDGYYPARYRYQTNAMTANPTLGGEGPNVEYKFNITMMPISNNNLGTMVSSSDTINGPASVINGYKHAGYQRGEIYRFGIIFYNNRGQSSSVKWIGDIRFPDISDKYSGDAVYIGATNVTPSTYDVSFEFADVVYSCVLTPAFTLKHYPTGAVGYTIVRAHRDTVNRTVLCSGLFGGLNYKSSISTYYPPTKLADQHDISTGHFWYDNQTTSSYNYSQNADNLSNTKLEFISPEININKNIAFGSATTDYLIYQGYANQRYAHYATSNEIYTYNNYVSMGGFYNPPDPFLTTFYHTTVSSGGAGTIRPTYRAINAFEIAGKSSNNDLTSATGSITFGTDKYKNYFDDNNDGYHGTVGVMSISTGVSVLDSNSQNPLYGTYIRLNPSQYNGPGYYSRLLTEYYACTGVLTSTYQTVNVYGGDTYITMFDYLRAFVDLERQTSYFSVLYFPVESSFNLALRSDRSYRHAYGDKYAYLMQETAGVQDPSWSSTDAYTQYDNLYTYNTVYSQQNKSKVYFQKDSSVITPTKFDCRVLYSDIKINGESIESWAKFRPNNYRDVDSTYGSVNALTNYKNQLFYWQTNAFGMLAVNQRELIPSTSVGTAPLVLGTGGILDRYDYVSYEIGTTDNINILKTNFGLYWFDINRKVLARFNNSIELLSKSKFMHSYFQDIVAQPTLSYDPLANEVLIGKVGSYGVTVYSELFDVFTGFYSFYPELSFNNSKVLITKKAGNSSFWLHRGKGNPGVFYTDTLPYADITIIANDKYPVTKVFDAIEFETEAISMTTATANDIDRTFTSMRLYDTYQNTGSITLTYNTNLRRKDRGFTVTVPRNAVKYPANIVTDILSVGSLDTTRLFKDRMRDKYLIMEFVYNGTTGTYKLRLPFIVTKYRISDR